VNERVAVTVQPARGASAQQAALDAWVDVNHGAGRLAVIAEGLFGELVAAEGTCVRQLAAGCVCCVGSVPLRVTLTRVLREHRPARLLLLLASDQHLERVTQALCEGTLAEELNVQPTPYGTDTN